MSWALLDSNGNNAEDLGLASINADGVVTPGDFRYENLVGSNVIKVYACDGNTGESAYKKLMIGGLNNYQVDFFDDEPISVNKELVRGGTKQVRPCIKVVKEEADILSLSSIKITVEDVSDQLIAEWNLEIGADNTKSWEVGIANGIEALYITPMEDDLKALNDTMHHITIVFTTALGNFSNTYPYT